MKKINTTWIIDDDPIQVFVATKNMKNINFSQNIRALKNGSNALKELHNLTTAIDEGFPDVTFLDINMPQMDGWQFLEEFNKMSFEKEAAIYLVTTKPVKKSRSRENSRRIRHAIRSKPAGRNSFSYPFL